MRNRNWFFVSVFLTATLFLLSVAPRMTAVAQDEQLLGGQRPSQTVQQIFGPIGDFLTKVFNFFSDTLEKISNFEWLKNQFLGILNTIDGWIHKITGLNIGELLKEIGNLLIGIFDLIINFVRKLWPF